MRGQARLRSQDACAVHMTEAVQTAGVGAMLRPKG
jgi:hypothetical protein